MSRLSMLYSKEKPQSISVLVHSACIYKIINDPRYKTADLVSSESTNGLFILTGVYYTDIFVDDKGDVAKKQFSKMVKFSPSL